MVCSYVKTANFINMRIAAVFLFAYLPCFSRAARARSVSCKQRVSSSEMHRQEDTKLLLIEPMVHESSAVLEHRDGTVSEHGCTSSPMIDTAIFGVSLLKRGGGAW
jgi:hypothetical protein